MSAETNKVLVRRFYDQVLNGRTDHVLHDPQVPAAPGPQGMADVVSVYQVGVKGHWNIEEIFSSGDRVVVRWTNSARHVGDFLGIPPTGRSCAIAGIDIYRLEDGRLAEHWHVIDQLAMLQQLGLIPAPGTAPA